MLRFAPLTLSNPAKPELKPLEVKALISSEEFGLAVSANIAEKLSLNQIDLRAVQEAGKQGDCLVPYMGPVRVTCSGKDVFTGAMNCIQGVAIGASLAKELQLDRPEQRGAGFRDGLVPFIKTNPAENLMDSILIKEQAIDASTCQWICDYVRDHKQRKTGVEAVENSVMPGAENYRKAKEHARDAFSIDTRGLEPRLRYLFYQLFTSQIMPFFDVKIESWERPQLLSYERGGKYEPHADGEISVNKPGGARFWRRFHNRDISVILYLNEEFTGGNLVFPDLNLTIRPKPGLLVAFPSTADYMHGAQPTTSGDRMILVTWAAIEGTARMLGEAGEHVYMKSFQEEDSKV